MLTKALMASIISSVNADKLWTWSQLSWSVRPQEWSHWQPCSFGMTDTWLSALWKITFMFTVVTDPFILIKGLCLNDCESKSSGKQMIMFHAWLTWLYMFLSLLKGFLMKTNWLQEKHEKPKMKSRIIDGCWYLDKLVTMWIFSLSH